MSQTHQILIGDCIEMMRTLPDKSVHTCVTSPPRRRVGDGPGRKPRNARTPGCFA